VQGSIPTIDLVDRPTWVGTRLDPYRKLYPAIKMYTSSYHILQHYPKCCVNVWLALHWLHHQPQDQ